MNHLSIYYLSLGSNLGKRRDNLNRALEFLNGIGEVLKVSSIIETEPEGMEETAGRFLNMACMLRSGLEPLELLRELKEFERTMGRDLENSHYRSRTIDIDILLADHPEHGNIVLETEELTVPHRRMPERSFVLIPLYEIAPGAVHPVLKRTVEELWERVRE